MIPTYLTEGIRQNPENLPNSSPTMKLFSFPGLNGDDTNMRKLSNYEKVYFWKPEVSYKHEIWLTTRRQSWLEV